ncbi:MAG: multidrug efflux SMR transporter [Deferribacteraceae bacterium]|jgi:small multidrug resistance pump|nr:multidrug efflux SMR transporter [Deferribacteraceae bacterium]
MKNWLFLILAVLLEITATTALKMSGQFSKLIPSLITIAGYIGSFWFLSLSLRTVPLGVAYAVWSGLGIIALAAIGVLKFKQMIDFPAVIGIVLIVAGVFVLLLFSKMEVH